MNKHISRNSDLDPNMLMILLLILSTFSRKPVFFAQRDRYRNKYNNKSKDKDSYKADDNDNGLNDYNNKQIIANSNSANDINDNTDYCLDNTDLKDIDSVSRVTVTKEDKDCGELINSGIIPEYPNKPIKPFTENNQIVITVPVLLSQFQIEFYCETSIELDFPASEIKRTNKNVILQDCKLLPEVNKLFLSGHVREDIEYAAIKSEMGGKNNIRHVIVEIPFKCTTIVTYFTLPIINSAEEQVEIETLRSDDMGNELNEKTQISREEFNEKIYCKLVRDEINELYISEDFYGSNLNNDGLCKIIDEKLVVKLTLKMIQEQQININKVFY